jgi:hypothetical protein
VAGVCNKVEFEGVREGKDNKEDQEEFDDRGELASGRSHDVDL